MDKNAPENSEPKSGSSLSLSLTPPIPMEDDAKEDSNESISEHISSGSFEHDRSLHEIEISTLDDDTLTKQFPGVDLPEVKELDCVEPENQSVVSGDVVDSGNNVRSILDEILCNEQFRSGEPQQDSLEASHEESLNIFQNVDFDDHSIFGYRQAEGDIQIPNLENEGDIQKRLIDFEELLALKDSTIAVLTSELESFRETSNPNTGSTFSTTEYKQLQEECQSRLLEYNSMIIYKNELIQKLSESLDQSVTERKELLKQIDGFKEEITQLQSRLQETTKMVAEHMCREINIKARSDESSQNISLDTMFDEVKNKLDPQYENILEGLRLKLEVFLKETLAVCREDFDMRLNSLEDKRNLEKEDYELEISRLQDLLTNIKCSSAEVVQMKMDLEVKHSREMEELRTYFEKKCADLEKNYSEEIFSQQSRKMSDSSNSEPELTSDPIFSHSPGPDGDVKLEVLPNLTKKDVVNLHNELNSLLNKINKFNLDSMTDDDFTNLMSEISKSNLSSLLKYDLSAIRNDLQNKYHAELEMLREDNENNVDVLHLQYENKLKSIEKRYQEEVEMYKVQLDDLQRQHLSISSAIQEVASSGEFEISEVIQSYERRLQEQVTLAKIDIISALEMQIQRLAANESDDEEWPSELLQLRDRFTEQYEEEIKELKRQHQEEIEKLKEEHSKALNKSLERVKRRSLKDSDSLSKGEMEILRERDNLKRQVSSLRHLLSELLKYFTECEDELNNTLVDELVKQGFDKTPSNLDEDPNDSSRSSESCLNVTRVHLTPNFDDLINLIDTTCQDEGDSKDISIDLKNELGTCLKKLRQEANAILTLTTNLPKPTVTRSSSIEDRVNSLTRQLISESQAKARYKEELEEVNKYVECLEKEKENLEGELEQVIAKSNVMEADLMQARQKIAELIENGHKEIVSEGYGEEGPKLNSVDATTSLAELHEKARSMLAQSRTSADPALLQLIEELCKVGEMIKEDSRKERLDLLQQIEVADKKYRTTQRFLDEQAAEREQERDEAQKKIDLLHVQLRERDKDKMNCERVATEVNGVCCREYNCTKLQVEQLEQQLQEMTRSFQAEVERCKDLESERNEAVEKIQELREIIRDLENQSEGKSKTIEDLTETVQRLDGIIDKQDKSLNRLKLEDLPDNIADIGKLVKHVESLEGELQQLRFNAELAGGDSTLNQIKKQIYEIETLLEKRTKELETLHSTESTNCSSPSEDLSARDLIGVKSPSVMDECEVPLQQLARLKEKLIRHSRAEDAAIKRIKDLEMQVFSLRQGLEETSEEKEYMKKQLQEHIVLISDLQIRLDEQRIRAEHIEKQTNTSLEMRIYDMQNEITSLQDKLQNKEKALNQQQALLLETKERLKNMEQEVKEDDLIISMQKELEKLRHENADIRAKFHKETQMVPNIVENIISDKNVDIEKLKEKLDETEKLLEMYTSLNLTKAELQTISNLKSNSFTSVVEAFSILGLSQIDQMRHLDNLSRSVSSPEFNFQTKDFTMEPEISAIEGPKSLNFIKNSTALSQKHVHFEDIETMKNKIGELQEQLRVKDETLKNYEERLKLLISLENKIENLQVKLDETEKALAKATETFEKEQQELKNRERDLGVQLVETRLHLEEKEKQIGILEQDSSRKDEMCLAYAKEKKDLERALNAVKEDSFESIQAVANDNARQMRELQQNLSQQLEDKDMEIISLQTQVESWSHKFEILENKHKTLGTKNKTLEEKLQTCDEECTKLRKESQNLMSQMEMAMKELNTYREKLNKKRKLVRDHENLIGTQKKTIEELKTKIKQLQEVITDRECEIEISKEDAKHYQNNIDKLESETKELQRQVSASSNEAKIKELEQELSHLTDLVNEKDRLIARMSEDGEQLHLNLTTIKTKLKESGNIVDLSNKFKEEQKKNSELLQEIHCLKAQLLKYRGTLSSNSTEDITDQLRRELDCSAQIDSNILSAVSDQSLSSLSETHDVDTYKKALYREKSSKKQLLLQINALQAKNAELYSLVEKQKAALSEVQSNDAQLIQQLRIQLDSTLDREGLLKKELEDKNAAYKRLEADFETIKRGNLNSASRTDSTEYKNLPTKEAIELAQLKTDMQTLQNERDKLIMDLTYLHRDKLENENALKTTIEKFDSEKQKVKELEGKVDELNKAEIVLRDEIVRKKLDCENLMDQFEQDRANFLKQKEALLEQLRLLKHSEKSSQTSTVSDELLSKIQQINSALLDNRKLVECLKKVTDERNALEAENAQLKRDDPQNANVQTLISRCDFLFEKNLKLESVKKILIWQKRYLSDYVQTHQTHCAVQALPDNRFQKERRSRKKPIQRFKSCVLVVVAIIRMKFIVRRWHSRLRFANKINSRHYRHLTVPVEPRVSANFHLGQPVSNQHFSRVRSTNPFRVVQENIEEDRLSIGDVRANAAYDSSWSGNSPPSKDRGAAVQIGSRVLQKNELTPLRAPELLAQFVERFDQIQDKMGIIIDKGTT